jgi:enamine deaminase RidA (YjgF/YER057c/UK114 family)
MGKQIVDPGWEWVRRFQYSPGVRAGNLVFLAGQVAVNTNGELVGPGDIKAQTRQIFENMRTILGAAGLTLDDLVEVVSYHVDIRDLPKVGEVKSEFIRKDFPTWTAVGVTALASPGYLLEIKAIAAVPGGGR